TTGAEVRRAPEKVRAKLGEAETLVARQASGNNVPGAVQKDEGALLRGQGLRPLAVHVRQVAAERLNDVGESKGLRALRARRLHRCALLWQSRRVSAIVASQTLLGETPAASPRALNRKALRRLAPIAAERT